MQPLLTAAMRVLIHAVLARRNPSTQSHVLRHSLSYFLEVFLQFVSVDEQQLQALRYAQGTDMKLATQAVFLMIVSKASGRDRFKLNDSNLADAVGVHRTTVIRVKKELANFSFLKIKGNIHTFL